MPTRFTRISIFFKKICLSQALRWLYHAKQGLHILNFDTFHLKAEIDTECNFW